jgi:hypothetical protein
MLVLMSILFVLSVRGVFNVFLQANELDTEALNPGVRVDREKLNKAYDFVYSKNRVILDMGPETLIKPTDTEKKKLSPTPTVKP